MKTIRWVPEIVDDGQPAEYIREVGDVYDLMVKHGFRDEPKESLFAFFLDEERRVMGMERVTTGTKTMSIAPLREAFAFAVVRRAAALLIAHNHPPGDPRPSSADREVTEAFWAIGRLLDVDLMDHVIVAAGSSQYYSFRKQEVYDREEA